MFNVDFNEHFTALIDRDNETIWFIVVSLQ